jgi:hypothetical protein
MKTISWFLIFSLASAQLASANTQNITPEAQFLKRAIAIQGQTLTQDEAQAELSQALSSYRAQAPVDGQADRMEKALVELQLYTPAQAQSFVAGAKAAAGRVQKAGSSERADAIASEMAQLNTPSGAQFSDCTPILLTSLGLLAIGAGFEYGSSSDAAQAAAQGLGETVLTLWLVVAVLQLGGAC